MTDKLYNNNTWTFARLNTFIKSGLRAAWQRWPPKHRVKKAASVERGIYLCAGYKKRKHKVPVTILNNKRKRVNNIFVDHIEPVIDPVKGFISWDEFISRLFCEDKGLQVLCADCHKRKTNDERTLRTGRTAG